MKLFLATVVLAISAAALGALAGQDEAATQPRGPRLRVMSYNIHVGRGTDGKLDMERIARVIKAADPDLVAVQEVDIGANRTEKIDEAAELGRLTGMHVRFGKARDYDGGEYGQVILSKRPIEAFEVHELPGSADQEQRIALVARIAGDENVPPVRFVGTHLHHQGEAHRVAQAGRLIEILTEDEDAPLTLIAGDLNAEPGSESMGLFLEHYRNTTPDDALTYPAEQPIKKIDWILLPRDSKWQVAGARVVEEPVASDHRPVVVDLVLPQ